MIKGIKESDLTDSDVEIMLLAALLAEGKYILELDISEQDFSEPYHWKVFRVMLDLAISSKLNVHMLILEAKTAEGKDFAAGLSEAALNKDRDSIDRYAKRLKELRRKREILAGLQDAVELIKKDDSTPDEILKAVTITDDVAEEDFVDAATLMERIVKGVDKPKKCYSTGLRKLDEAMLGGMYAGWTYGIAGPAKGGKTTLAHTISHNLAMQNVPHAYIAMEMGSGEIQQRNMARMMGLNSAAFHGAPNLIKSKAEHINWYNAVKYLDAPGIKPDDLLHKLLRAKHKHEITGFILDYWQIIGGKPRGDSKAEYLLDVAQNISNFARKNGLWCLFLAQLNDDGSVFASSGLEKACDQLYCLERAANQELKNQRWLRMKATRYTAQYDLGSPEWPAFAINQKVGPYFEEI